MIFNKTNKWRIHLCKETNTEVIQIWTSKSWLCLHHDSLPHKKSGIEQDLKQVKLFKKAVTN